MCRALDFDIEQHDRLHLDFGFHLRLWSVFLSHHPHIDGHSFRCHLLAIFGHLSRHCFHVCRRQVNHRVRTGHRLRDFDFYLNRDKFQIRLRLLNNFDLNVVGRAYIAVSGVVIGRNHRNFVFSQPGIG